LVSPCRITAALEFDSIEERTIVDVIGGVDLGKHEIIGPEFDNLVCACTYRS